MNNNIFPSWKNIALFAPVIISISITSLLTITHVRMYGHDTRGWMLPSRAWSNDIFVQGDVPLWFGVTRYGFPTTAAQFVGSFWSPVALILTLAGSYGPKTVAYEFLGWRLVALLGTWWYTRSYTKNIFLSLTISSIFCASGVFASQDIELGIFIAISVVPWIIGGIDRCMIGRTWQEKCLGCGVLSIALVVLLWSGYPGIWIMLPIYLIPYILFEIFSQKHMLIVAKNITIILLACILALAGWAPVLFTTFQFPLFNNNMRINNDSSIGTFQNWGLLGLLFANPSHLLQIGNSNNTPIYIGIIVTCSVFWVILSYIKLFFAQFRSNIKNLAIFTFVMIASIFSLKENNIQLLISVFILYIVVYFVPFINLRVEHKKKYIKLVITSIWILFWILSSEYTKYLRENIVPFSLVRWQAMHFYLIDFFCIEMGCIIIYNYINDIQSFRLHNDSILRLLLFLLIIMLVLSPLVISHSSSDHAPGWVEQFGIAPLVWSVAFISMFLICGFLAIYLWGDGMRDGYLVANSISLSTLIICLGSVIYAQINIANPPLWWNSVIMIPEGTRAMLDVVHLFTILIVAGKIYIKYNGRKYLANIILLLCVCDVSVASLRYLGDTEMVNVEQVRGPLVVPRIQDNLRFPTDAGRGLVSLELPAPHMWVYPEVLPDVARVDSEWGEPSVFNQFAVFPASWSFGPTSGSIGQSQVVTVSRQAMRGQADEGSSLPACNLADAAPAPTANILRFASTIIEVNVKSSCQRLLVWTDTWAEGWTATLNGSRVDVLRVNGAVRGVMIEAGASRLVWRYAPAGFGWSLGVMASAVTISFGAIVFALAAAKLRPSRDSDEAVSVNKS